MKNNNPVNKNPVKNNPKADNVATSKTNVCGTDITLTGNAADEANKDCKDKIDSAMAQMNIPGPEAALPQ